MVVKTREKLIDVARQLFAHKGMENTTMNDIAAASDKGRRTIYTYFKNKREIYNAVIERESEQLVGRLREVACAQAPPEEKLERYLRLRFDILAEAVPKHDTLRSFFGRDIRRIDRIRRLALSKEIELFRKLIKEGVDSGVFDPVQAQCLPALESMVFQGSDYSHLRGNFDETGLNASQVRDHIIRFIINGIKK